MRDDRRAAEVCRTPRRWREGEWASGVRQVLEWACPLALSVRVSVAPAKPAHVPTLALLLTPQNCVTNTTSRSAYLVPDSGVTSPRDLWVRGVLTGRPGRGASGPCRAMGSPMRAGSRGRPERPLGSCPARNWWSWASERMERRGRMVALSNLLWGGVSQFPDCLRVCCDLLLSGSGNPGWQYKTYAGWA
jgi:hypothetical protein